MALNKAAKQASAILSGTTNPNTAKISPAKIGDLYVDTTNKQLFFAFGLTTTSWGTCGTAGS